MVEARDEEAGITRDEYQRPNLFVIAMFVALGLAITFGFGIGGVLLSD